MALAQGPAADDTVPALVVDLQHEARCGYPSLLWCSATLARQYGLVVEPATSRTLSLMPGLQLQGGGAPGSVPQLYKFRLPYRATAALHGGRADAPSRQHRRRSFRSGGVASMVEGSPGHIIALTLGCQSRSLPPIALWAASGWKLSCHKVAQAQWAFMAGSHAYGCQCIRGSPETFSTTSRSRAVGLSI